MLKLTVKAPERRQRRRSGVFIVNFEYFHLILVFLCCLRTGKRLLGIFVSFGLLRFRGKCRNLLETV